MRLGHVGTGLLVLISAGCTGRVGPGSGEDGGAPGLTSSSSGTALISSSSSRAPSSQGASGTSSAASTGELSSSAVSGSGSGAPGSSTSTPGSSAAVPSSSAQMGSSTTMTSSGVGQSSSAGNPSSGTPVSSSQGSSSQTTAPSTSLGISSSAGQSSSLASTSMTPSQQIAAVLAAPDGPVDLLVDGVISTLGFFVQAERTGPALLVSAPGGGPEPGDLLRFRVTEVTTVRGQRRASAIADLMGLGQSGFSGFVQDVSAETSVDALGTVFNAEVVSATVIVRSRFTEESGNGTWALADTQGIVGNPRLKLRLSRTSDAIDYAIVPGCQVRIPYATVIRNDPDVELWTGNWDEWGSVVQSCPPAVVEGAYTEGNSYVIIQLSGPVFTATPADFTITPTLGIMTVTVTGQTIALFTQAQTPGVPYTVTVGPGVVDRFGQALGPPNSAFFNGDQGGAILEITEVAPNLTGATDLVELRVRVGGAVSGYTLQQDMTSPTILATLPNVLVNTNDIIMIHLNPATAMGAAPSSETTSMGEFPAATHGANSDNAWDFHGGAAGITYSGRVLTVRNAANTIQDAVPFVRNNGNPAAFSTELQALQSAGYWLPTDCGGAPCTTLTTPTSLQVSANWESVSTLRTGASVRRMSTIDSNTGTDWAVGPNSLGSPNP